MQRHPIRTVRDLYNVYDHCNGQYVETTSNIPPPHTASVFISAGAVYYMVFCDIHSNYYLSQDACSTIYSMNDWRDIFVDTPRLCDFFEQKDLMIAMLSHQSEY